MKFLHRNLFITAALFAFLCVPIPAFATLDSLAVNIDDAITEYQAYSDDASIFMTASDLASVFETEYTHDTEKNEVSYIIGKSLFGKKEATLTIDSNTLVVAGEKVVLDAAPVSFEDEILIPLNAITTIWNASFGYNNDSLYIHTDGSEVIVPLTPKVFVEKQTITIGEKSSVIRYIRIPESSKLKADVVLANNNIGTTEKLDNLAVRSSAKAAINGGFFQNFDSTKAQEPYGILIKDGKLIHSDNTGSTLGFTQDGKVKLGMVHSVIQVKIGESSYTATLMNHSPATDSDTIALFTSAYGESLSSTGTALIVQNGIISAISDSKTVNIPEDGCVVLFTGQKAKEVNNLQKNDTVSYTVSYVDANKAKADWSDVQTAIGAGPILVNNGKVVFNPAKEGFTDETSFQIAVARSAIGITEDNTVLLVGNVKCSAEELAEVMVELGAVQAIAMDSGASSGLYSVADEPVAAPMKAISNALIFK